ncbi:MAG: hypothetical protein IPP07_20510 [Holophagales bacterium]|nr:hypothetical protein [Holophagales bacterium]MBK9967131.1 hypothetical protein [Holophagales bacterium]
MARTPAPKRPASRPQAQQAAASPSPRLAANPAPADAAPVFPFARTVEDDELRDMSGYGWGV